jgi:hypothetical protein
VKLYGAAYAAECWRDTLRTVIALVIAAAVLLALIAVIGDAGRSAALEDMFRILGIIAVVDLIWSTSCTIWPRRAPAATR